MRKVILYIATSVDGYIADTAGGIDWLSTGVTPTEADTSYETLLRSVDTVLLGRTTYNQITEELSPEDYPYSEQHSYVLTSRPRENLPGITFVNESVVKVVERLKKEEGGNIWVVGGSQLIAPLVEHDLIDEYQLATIPVLLGKGISLFLPFEGRIPLVPQEVHMIGGIVYRTYVRAH